MPPGECARCKESRNSINGLYCGKTRKYVQYAAVPPCGPRQNDKDMTNNTPAIIRPENIQIIVQAAPQSYNDNKNSHDRCIYAGQELLAEIRRQGMNDGLDRQAAAFIDKARRTVRVMNERRSPVTKLFDEVRSAFTTLENETDPAKPGTVGHELQRLRDQYAARRRAEEERRRQEALARQRAEEARRRYRAAVEDDLRRRFQDHVSATVSQIARIDAAVTLDNYDASLAVLRDMRADVANGLDPDWLDSLHTAVPAPQGADAYEVETEIKQRLFKQWDDQYTTEAGDAIDSAIDRLPSKKANLERIAQANAEEAARIKAEMEARRKAEAERMEKERAEREAEERRKTELERKAQEMQSLFDGQAAAAAYQPKAKVTKRISLLNPEGIMPVISLWWSKEGCALSTDELAKMFKRQITFCERLANKEGVLIQDESVEYVDEVKAK